MTVVYSHHKDLTRVGVTITLARALSNKKPQSLCGYRSKPIRTASAEVFEFRFCSFQERDIGIRAIPKREELLVLRPSLRRVP
jgi:hypothetical protein